MTLAHPRYHFYRRMAVRSGRALFRSGSCQLPVGQGTGRCVMKGLESFAHRHLHMHPSQKRKRKGSKVGTERVRRCEDPHATVAARWRRGSSCPRSPTSGLESHGGARRRRERPLASRVCSGSASSGGHVFGSKARARGQSARPRLRRRRRGCWHAGVTTLASCRARRSGLARAATGRAAAATPGRALHSHRGGLTLATWAGGCAASFM